MVPRLSALLVCLVLGMSPAHAQQNRSADFPEGLDGIFQGAPETQRVQRQPQQLSLVLETSDTYHIQRALGFALEFTSSGTQTTWQNSTTGHHGVIIPSKTFNTNTGQTCRKFERTLVVGSAVTRYEGTACRQTSSAWSIRQETVVPATSVARAPTYSTPAVQPASTSSKALTAEAQTLLTQLGYNPGPIDGLYGEQTRRAIEAFQREQGLVPDGQTSNELITSLQVAASKALSAIVFTLDGIDALSEVSPLLESRPGGSTISYLEPRIEEVWQLPENDVHSLPWTGRTADTALAVEQAKGFITLLVRKASNDQKPLVIVGHSWGSVLAYRALVELSKEEIIKQGDIDQLITIGSPLFEENIVVQKFARQHAGWIGAAPADLTVRQWQSFYTEHDCLGGGVPETGVEHHNLLTSETKCLKAHNAYHEDPQLLHQIAMELRDALAPPTPQVAAAPTSGSPVTTQPQTSITEQTSDNGRPWLGMNLVDERCRPPQVTAVVPRGPADTAGIKSGDYIKKYEWWGKKGSGGGYEEWGMFMAPRGCNLPGTDLRTLRDAVNKTPIGDTAKVIITRNGKEIPLKLVVGSAPSIPQTATEQRAAASPTSPKQTLLSQETSPPIQTALTTEQTKTATPACAVERSKTVPQSSGNYERGLELFQQADYAGAYKVWLPLANNGDARAQTMIGELYKNSWGVAFNARESERWHIMAAEQGYPEGQYNLGNLYVEGWGITDCNKGMAWLRKAAEQGHGKAQMLLAYIYESGQNRQWMCVPRNVVQTYVWATLAAGANDREVAQQAQGLQEQLEGSVDMTPAQIAQAKEKARLLQQKITQTQPAQAAAAPSSGQSDFYWAMTAYDSKDYGTAFKTFEPLGNAGDACAQHMLGFFYDKGLGVSADEVKAREWYQKAAAQGDAEAAQRLAVLNRRQVAATERAEQEEPPQSALASSPPPCLSGICIGSTIGALSNANWDRLRINVIHFRDTSALIGITKQEATALGKLRRGANWGDSSSIRGALQILSKVDVVCRVSDFRGEIKMPAKNTMEVTFSAQPSHTGESQLFRVARIERSYSYTPNQKDEWIKKILERFPEAVTYGAYERGSRKGGVVYISGGRGGQLMLFAPYMPLQGRSNFSDADLARHPACPRSEIVIE